MIIAHATAYQDRNTRRSGDARLKSMIKQTAAKL
jgi:hypothetical protein